MRVLLDAHILPWWLADYARLPAAAAAVIADRDTDVLVSAATAWEISIKHAAGQLEVPDDFFDAIAANEFETLAITAERAMVAGRLPPSHADPFARMLVAQAQIEALTL